MYRLLTPIVLCLVAHTAAAQCVAGAAPPAPARQGGELIATATAGTHNGPSMHKVSTGSRAPARTIDDEHPRRTGPAMLLTAVAIMSAIALRRVGMSRR